MRSTELKPVATERVETRYRRIVTPIPVPDSIPVIQRLRAVEPVSMSGMPPTLWHEAEGSSVRDPYGNQWIDFTSGILVANAGHSHPRILEAIRQATDRKLLVTYAFSSQDRLDLLEKLVRLSPLPDSKAMLYSAGTEATESALMLMRLHGKSISPEKGGILSFAAGFHGRTLGASLASGSPPPDEKLQRERAWHYQIPYPICPRCPWGRDAYDHCGEWCFEQCLATLEERGIGPEQIAGIIAEPILGWATWPLPDDFVRSLSAWAKQHDILLAFDEIQCGCGRTGKFFGHEHLGVVPDLILLGKGLSSSVPVSAVLGPRWLMDLPPPGEMSTTHGGNPLCARASLANLEVIEEERLVEAAARTGARVLEELAKLELELPAIVHSVHGKGLFITVHLNRPETVEPDIALADAVAEEAVRRGVMLFTTGRGCLKIAPPLSIELEAALEAVGVLRECLLAVKGDRT
jgi:4-aminobutyrate aminotransferase-like enzyme